MLPIIGRVIYCIFATDTSRIHVLGARWRNYFFNCTWSSGAERALCQKPISLRILDHSCDAARVRYPQRSADCYSAASVILLDVQWTRICKENCDTRAEFWAAELFVSRVLTPRSLVLLHNVGVQKFMYVKQCVWILLIAYSETVLNVHPNSLIKWVKYSWKLHAWFSFLIFWIFLKFVFAMEHAVLHFATVS
jgi:hypothetical protein